jgi:hypothetical protein
MRQGANASIAHLALWCAREKRPNVLRFSGGAIIDREDVRADSAFKIALISRAPSAVRCKRLLGGNLFMAF